MAAGITEITDHAEIMLVALLVAIAGALLLLAILCIAVYDPAKTAGMPPKQRVGFCLRQLGSWWPWM